MEVLGTISSLLMFIMFTAVIVGLIKPAWVKQKTRKKVVLIYLSLSVLMLICAVATLPTLEKNILISKTDKDESKQFKVISISDFSYTSKGVSVVNICIGTNKDNYFDFSVPRSKIYEGFKVKSIKNNSDLICGGVLWWKGKQYLFSSKHPTEIYFKINLLDKQKKEAEISTYVKGIDSNFLSFFTTPIITLKVTGKNFDNLTANF